MKCRCYLLGASWYATKFLTHATSAAFIFPRKIIITISRFEGYNCFKFTHDFFGHGITNLVIFSNFRMYEITCKLCFFLSFANCYTILTL